MSEKEFDLKAQPFLDLTIRFYRAMNHQEGRGVTCLKTSNADVIVNGKNVGSISGSTNGTMVLADTSHGAYDEFMCDAKEVWLCFQKAIDNKTCPECGMIFDHKPGCSKET